MFDQPSLSYAEIIRLNAKRFHAKPAAVCGDEVLRWSDFQRRTSRVARGLADLGIKRGDRVCIVATNSIDVFVLIWGVVKAGGVIVLLNAALAPETQAIMAAGSRSRLLVADSRAVAGLASAGLASASLPEFALGRFVVGGGTVPDGWDEAADIWASASDADFSVDVAPSDTFCILYSSGSTGIPKGIECSHFSRLTYMMAFGWALNFTRTSVSCCATQLSTTGAWMVTLPSIYVGATIVLIDQYTPETFLAAIEKHRCTHTWMVPTQYLMALDSPDLPKRDVTSLSVLAYGGQAMAESTVGRLQAEFPNAGIYESGGTTEAYICVATPQDRADGKLKTIGRPLFGGDVRVISDKGVELPAGEIGEIVSYGPNLMKGYFDNPDANAAALWHDERGRSFMRSGDLGRIDADGYVQILGRSKDMIKSGGYNIFAADIEEVFMRHPDVVEVAAVGIPHPKWLETPILLAIMREKRTVDEEGLREWGNAQLSKYQRVSKVEFRDDFPRAAYNKIQKKALREPYWSEEDDGGAAA